MAVLFLCVAGAASSPAASPPTIQPLTTVRAVHELNTEASDKHPRVRLRGVVTSTSVWATTFFFQDGTAGLAVRNDSSTKVASGDRVEIEGEAASGFFAPVVHAAAVHLRGTAPMPHARLFTSQELLGGGQDGNWISVRGVVRSARLTTSHDTPVLSLMVEVNGNVITVQVLRYQPEDANRLVDATVRIAGACATSFNDKQQFIGVGLQVPSMAYVRIEEAGAADPYAHPPMPVRSLLHYKPGFQFEHRLEISGTVTYQELGHSLYVQDGKDGLLLATDQRTPVAVGTKIVAVGFASPGDYSPVLRQANFRVAGAGAPIAPVTLRVEEMLRKGYFVTAPYDARLVELTGRLVETRSRLNDVSWIFQDRDSQFTASLQRAPGSPDLARMDVGSIVAVTGVFTTQLDENRQPTSFSVLLRSAGDLVVVKPAPWWNMSHAMDLLLVVLAIALSIALWGATLRRRVREQTQMLRESEQRFRNQAHYDGLTGLVSRSFLQEQLKEATQHARRTGAGFGLLMIDLDHFKQVNDTLGHHAGDELLCLVAERIRGSVRKGDTVARMGGDEFIVMLHGIDGSRDAEMIGAKVVANVSAPAEIGGLPMLVSASVGVCVYPDGGTDPEVLLKNVDAAMYKAKAAGRNSFSVYGKHKLEAETAQRLAPAGY